METNILDTIKKTGFSMQELTASCPELPVSYTHLTLPTKRKV